MLSSQSSSTTSTDSRRLRRTDVDDGRWRVGGQRFALASSSSAGVSSARCRVLDRRVNSAALPDEVENAGIGEARNGKIDDRAQRRVDGEHVREIGRRRREKALGFFRALLRGDVAQARR